MADSAAETAGETTMTDRAQLLADRLAKYKREQQPKWVCAAPALSWDAFDLIVTALRAAAGGADARDAEVNKGLDSKFTTLAGRPDDAGNYPSGRVPKAEADTPPDPAEAGGDARQWADRLERRWALDDNKDSNEQGRYVFVFNGEIEKILAAVRTLPPAPERGDSGAPVAWALRNPPFKQDDPSHLATIIARHEGMDFKFPLYASPTPAADAVRPIAWRYRAKDYAERRAWSYADGREPKEKDGWDVEPLYAAPPAADAVRAHLLSVMEDISNADESEPREPDDADWRFRFLETKRVAKLAVEMARSLSPATGKTSGDHPAGSATGAVR